MSSALIAKLNKKQKSKHMPQTSKYGDDEQRAAKEGAKLQRSKNKIWFCLTPKKLI